MMAWVFCSLDEFAMSKWNNPCYGGKIVMTPTPKAKRYKLTVPKNASRVQFDIEQEARKQELVVQLNAQVSSLGEDDSTSII
jgi:hypothetical protein